MSSDDIKRVIIPDAESNNEDLEIEKVRLCKELRAVREAIAYKADDDCYLEIEMRDLALDEALDMEYYRYKHQDLETLLNREERLVRDLALVGVDASRENERVREEYESDEVNEQVDLDDEDDDDDEEGELESLF
jgi:hypothetical protein